MKIVIFQSSYEEPYPLHVQGEASYRDEIEEVTGFTGDEEGVNADDFTAHLILDDNNRYDRGNAVAVEIDGQKVGYLSRSDAKKYRAKLIELGLSDVVGACSASIKGGFLKRDGEQADFGVRLDIIIEELQVEPAHQPVQQVTAPPVVETPAAINPTRSPLNQFFGWFFRSGKYRAWRVTAFVLLVTLVCFACTVWFGLFLRATGQ